MTHPKAPGVALNISEAMIRKLVEAFYAKVRTDAVLGPVFEAKIHDWNEHLAKVRQHIDSKKAEIDLDRAQSDADNAEDDALFAIDYAYGAVEEAEYAVLDATLARVEADELAASGASS